jgi:hypothetical protein
MAAVQHNENDCEFLRLFGHDDLRQLLLQPGRWGVVGLWRLRGVCQSLRRWSTATLASLPRVVCIGGADPCGEDEEEGFERSTASVEVLDLSTMRWTQSDMSGGIPALPLPRDAHTASSFADGRVLVCGGFCACEGDNVELWMTGTPVRERHVGELKMALQWTPESGVWAALPEMPGSRGSAASVVLSDGRAMVIGGCDCQAADGQTVLNSVLVLAADGSRWSQLPAVMASNRCGTAAVLLPGDKVLVASGSSGVSASGVSVPTKTAELWDPATQTWTTLPDMLEAVEGAAACILPSGCVAVVGGSVASDDAAAYDDGAAYKARKTPSWPRSWATFSLLQLYSRRNSWANLHLLGQTNTILA